MKAPRFWDNSPDAPGWQARLLAPASALWRLGAAWRARGITPYRAGVPVLCIGNLTAGGAGKTPMVAALMDRLATQGISAHVVSRGYGGRIAGPHMVDPTEDNAADVGDEPLLLAARGLAWIARDRAAGIRAAEEAGARLVLMDDGLQNPTVAKDAAIVMVDAGQGFGNGRLIPAGPLREPVEEGLARADLVVLVGAPAARGAAKDAWPVLEEAKVLSAELTPLQTGLPLEDERVIAFAGIGRPEKFFRTLRQMGAIVERTRSFPDHYVYPPAILRRLINEARETGALLVTTEKDAVRLPPALRAEVLTVQVRLDFKDWSPIDNLVERLLSA